MPWNKPKRLNRNAENITAISCWLLAVLILSTFVPQINFARGETYDNSSVIELNRKIKDRQQQMSDLQKQIDAYRQKISATQKQAITLKNQISILESSINATGLNLAKKNIEIQELELELELVEKKIDQETAHADDIKFKIAGALDQLRQDESRGLMNNLIKLSSFSRIFDEMHRMEILTNSLKAELDTLQQIKQSLQDNQKTLQDKKDQAQTAKDQLSEIKITLQEQQELKKRLFGNAQTSEATFQKRLSQLRNDQAAIDSDIVTLEKTIRQKQQILSNLPGLQGKFAWPVNPSRGISSNFHDSDYPFRYLFEHSGMDIRTAQGTAVQAADGGYVAKVFNGGLGDKPSYVMIMHANNLTTVYMHLSTIYVSPDTYITRGQIIGASGGTPGTSGAGRWTTGPHLHFEVRLNSVPVNPLNYLP